MDEIVKQGMAKWPNVQGRATLTR